MYPWPHSSHLRVLNMQWIYDLQKNAIQVQRCQKFSLALTGCLYNGYVLDQPGFWRFLTWLIILVANCESFSNPKKNDSILRTGQNYLFRIKNSLLFIFKHVKTPSLFVMATLAQNIWVGSQAGTGELKQKEGVSCLQLPPPRSEGFCSQEIAKSAAYWCRLR